MGESNILYKDSDMHKINNAYSPDVYIFIEKTYNLFKCYIYISLNHS